MREHPGLILFYSTGKLRRSTNPDRFNEEKKDVMDTHLPGDPVFRLKRTK